MNMVLRTLKGYSVLRTLVGTLLTTLVCMMVCGQRVWDYAHWYRCYSTHWSAHPLLLTLGSGSVF